MPIDFNQLRELLSSIAQTDIAELTLKSEDFELTVRKGIPIMPKGSSIEEVSSIAVAPHSPPPISQVKASPSPPPETPTTPATQQKWIEITSPMVGTFYRAPAPDEEPFVGVNDRITVGQTVCIIEAMKLMNEIEAEVSGQIVEILVKNGEPVEYGQTLMLVNPD